VFSCPYFVFFFRLQNSVFRCPFANKFSLIDLWVNRIIVFTFSYLFKILRNPFGGGKYLWIEKLFESKKSNRSKTKVNRKRDCSIKRKPIKYLRKNKEEICEQCNENNY